MNGRRETRATQLWAGITGARGSRARVGTRTRRRRYIVASVAAFSALTVVAIGSTGAYFTNQSVSAAQSGSAGALAAVTSLAATKSIDTNSGQTVSGQSSSVSWTAPTLTGSTGTNPVYIAKRNSVNSFALGAGATTLTTPTTTSLTDTVGGAPVGARQATQVATLRVAASTGDANTGSFALIGGQVYRWGTAKKDGTGITWATATTVTGPDFNSPILTPIPGFTEDIRQMAAGLDHLCALSVTGKVFCVGFNGSGQIGDGSTSGPTTAKEISYGALAGKTIISITAGDKFTCALASDGVIGCWGDNTYGQLGDGTTTNRLTPVAVIGTGVFATFKPNVIGASNYGMCAAKGPTYDAKLEPTYPGQNNRLACWGRNNWQQLGTTADSSAHGTPVDIADPNNVLQGVTKIVGGHAVYCVLNGDTTQANVACWGGGGLGMLGDGGTSLNPTPRAISAPPSGMVTGYSDVTVGYTVGCASKDAAFTCWGMNASGQLGIGTTGTGPFTPRNLTTMPGMTTGSINTLSVGPYSACASGTAGGLWCWGEGDGYGLGQGATTSDMTAPRAVIFNGARVLPGGSADLLAVNSGNEYQVARIDGKYYSWGRKLDDTVSAVPVELTGFPANVTKMAAGYYHACAINGTNSIWCVGNSANGKLGNTTAGTSSAATLVNDSAGVFTGKTLIDITAWDMGTCALASDGTIGCWGQNDVGQLGQPANSPASSNAPVAVVSTLFSVGSASKATKITSGWDTICVEAGPSGTRYIACWGSNFEYPLGAGVATSLANSATAIKITDPNNRFAAGVTALDAGRTTVCAVAASNSYTYCWGRAGDGQMGNASSATSATQTVTEAFTTAATDVSVAGLNVCATTATGPYCWGLRDSGGIGNGVTTAGYVVATAVVDSNSVLVGGSARMLSGGWGAMCMLATTGSLSCWGLNNLQALGQQNLNNTTNLANPSLVWSGTDPASPPISGVSTSCLDGALKTSSTTCSLVPGRTYWYQVNYTLPGADTWVSPTASAARS
ncbi:RCC1 domain-containing protein [Amnibacterium flavum]|uniref:Chromosome condensation regulator RCC1 n=1 Tax=Amnibacterium flavum TaxID=2173173 RepID=A0A2V1HVQ9_9MICO|nr:hypothetical protein [Amnibacterium flavum]PVZ95120.1 hypothetical protein DDQ50_00885 [Amnibacterium flavum]